MRVAVLGCGYVGTELARQLDAAGHDPVGVRRSREGVDALRDAGIEAVQADVTDADALAAVPSVDALVFSASSGRRGVEAARRVYVEGLRTVVEAFAARDDPPTRLVYTSSTGVYGDHGGDWVDETTPLEPTTDKTRVLAEAETVALDAAERGTDPSGEPGHTGTDPSGEPGHTGTDPSGEPGHTGIDSTVVRLAGIYGPGRYGLERYLDRPVTEGYRNAIHRDDAAGVVRFALEHPGDDVLLAVDDEPVSKWAFADWLADQTGRPRPPKRTRADRLADGALSEASRRRVTTSKRCSNHRLRERGYDFAYPTFREGYRAAIENQ